MTGPFRSFVILAGMRTGSNLLEATLNAITGVTCFGEAFNPAMLGWPGTDAIEGMTRAARDTDPLALLARLTGRPGHLPGFRYFPGHDPRVLDPILADRSCAKVILTRNPVDSFVSTLIARQTDQWKLNERETPVPARVSWDGAGFRAMLDETARFHRRIERGLQTTGQAGFRLDYGDLRDPAVLTGLMHWLGRTDLARVDPARDQIPQNPQPLAGKLADFDVMRADLAGMEPFELDHPAVFEPQRGPAVPSLAVSEAGRGLVFMPVRGGPDRAVRDWLATLGPVSEGWTRSRLREWKREQPGHRGFSVLRHPLLRAWTALDHLLGPAGAEQRALLRQTQRLGLPAEDAPALADRLPLFADFLGLLRRVLHGQTSLPVPPHWASQVEVLAGFARLSGPDLTAREDRLAEDLAHLARTVGIDAPRLAMPAPMPVPEALRDRTLARACAAAYPRDYAAFGFELLPPVADPPALHA